MPEILVVGTVTSWFEEIKEIAHIPEFNEKDLLEIYYGEHENCCFHVEKIRYNMDYKSFEYFNDNFRRWYAEKQLICLRRGASV